MWEGESPGALGLVCTAAEAWARLPYLEYWGSVIFLIPAFEWVASGTSGAWLPLNSWYWCLGSWKVRLKMICDVRLDNPQETDPETSNELLNIVNIVPLWTWIIDLDAARKTNSPYTIFHCFSSVIFHLGFRIAQFPPEGGFQKWVVVVSTTQCNSSND